MNGSLSSSKRTKHIKARYCFIKDNIDEGKIDLRYCPTVEMTADILNKPKNRAAFCRNRAKLMNVPVEYDDQVEFANTRPDLLPPEDCTVLQRHGNHQLPCFQQECVGQDHK